MNFSGVICMCAYQLPYKIDGNLVSKSLNFNQWGSIHESEPASSSQTGTSLIASVVIERRK